MGDEGCHFDIVQVLIKSSVDVVCSFSHILFGQEGACDEINDVVCVRCNMVNDWI